MPARLQRLYAEHGLTETAKLDAISSTAVRRVRDRRGTWILKLAAADRPQDTELRLLNAWAAVGLAPAVTAIADDAMLLEDLGQANLAEETPIDPRVLERVGALVRELHSVPVADLPGLDRELVRKQAGIDAKAALPAEVEQVSRDLCAQLLPHARNNRGSVHGDLHSSNVMRRADGTLAAIDPYGLSGSPTYDLAQFAVCWPGPPSEEQALQQLVSGYGSEPAHLEQWFTWMAIARWSNAAGGRPHEERKHRALALRRM